MSRNHVAVLVVLFTSTLCIVQRSMAETTSPNILYITVDDMSCDSVGAFGCKLPGTTPHIDRLASKSLKFEHAYVVVGNCMPSRNVMYSGLYPHHNGIEGFRQDRSASWPHLVDLFKSKGYYTAIRHKVSHSTPYSPYAWDLVLDDAQNKPHIKEIQSYYDSVKLGISSAVNAGKPFCLVINVSDPHKPFYGMGGGDRFIEDPHVPSRVFESEEIPIPGFLFKHPDVSREMAHYYSSVRRADDCVGAALKALDESDQAQNTVVFFLSDHGMPLPFAKTALYYHSLHTPLIVHWPGVTKPGSVDDRHMVSAVDILSTLCGIAGIDPPARQDGRSFLPLLQGESQSGREHVFGEYNENAGGNRQPMRTVLTKRFGYIFNPWSDGERLVRTATQGTITYRTMKKIAAGDAAVAKRLEMFEHRVVEEFYDYANDPDALTNLIDDPRYQEELHELRGLLEEHMESTRDEALEAFRHRDEPEFLKEFMSRQEDLAEQVRKKKGKAVTEEGDDESTTPATSPRPQKNLLKLQVPDEIRPGRQVTVTVQYDLPTDLGKQLLHVTLKQGNMGKRVYRKVVEVSKKGEIPVIFDVPRDVQDGVVSFAVFVGRDYQSSLQHLNTKPVKVD